MKLGVIWQSDQAVTIS